MFEFFLWVYQCMCCASFGEDYDEKAYFARKINDSKDIGTNTQYTAFVQQCEKSGIYLAPGAVINSAADASGSESSYEMCENA